MSTPVPETVTVSNPTLSPKVKWAAIASVIAIVLQAGLLAITPDMLTFLGPWVGVGTAIITAVVGVLAGYLKRDPDREWVVAGDPVPGDEAQPVVLEGELESEGVPEPEDQPDDGLPDLTEGDGTNEAAAAAEVDATPVDDDYQAKH